jgi:hypothetical protein
VGSSSPLGAEDMMQDSPVPGGCNDYSDVEIMSPTPAYDDDDYQLHDEDPEFYDTTESSMDDNDAMVMDSPAPDSRKPSADGSKLSVAE